MTPPIPAPDMLAETPVSQAQVPQALARARGQIFEAARGTVRPGAAAAIRLSPGGVLSALAALITGVYLTSVLMQVALLAWDYGIPRNVVKLVDLDQENNLPTWLSSTNLLISAGLAGFIAKAKQAQGDSYARYWLGLCVVFLYLSVDEAASLHEAPNERLRDILGTSDGALFAAWVVPALALAAIFAVLYARFLLSLPRRIQVLIVGAGTLYVLGAVGFELLSWAYRAPMFDADNHLASRDLTYMMINHLEEFLEMLGVAVFIYALLSYIEIERISISMTVSRGARGGPPEARTPGAT